MSTISHQKQAAEVKYLSNILNETQLSKERPT